MEMARTEEKIQGQIVEDKKEDEPRKLDVPEIHKPVEEGVIQHETRLEGDGLGGDSMPGNEAEGGRDEIESMFSGDGGGETKDVCDLILGVGTDEEAGNLWIQPSGKLWNTSV